MTAKEYAAYKAAVEAFDARHPGLMNLSATGDPYFSWRRCDVCQRPEGGDRYDCTGWNEKTEEIEEYMACGDCVYFFEYGELDDATMLEIEKDQNSVNNH